MPNARNLRISISADLALVDLRPAGRAYSMPAHLAAMGLMSASLENSMPVERLPG
jgi:hypothetical protein